MAPIASVSVRSHGWTCASPPTSSIFAFTASSFSRVRETSRTLAPFTPTRTAVASPMPDEAPVMSMVLPSTAVRRERSRNGFGLGRFRGTPLAALATARI